MCINYDGLFDEDVDQNEQKKAIASICLMECIACDKEFDVETMGEDYGGNYYCTDCWSVMQPELEKQYNELVDSGEIDTPPNYKGCKIEPKNEWGYFEAINLNDCDAFIITSKTFGSLKEQINDKL